MDKSNHPLKKYIIDARQSGMSNEEIVKELTKAGWRTHQINDFIAQAPEALIESSATPIISVQDLSKSYGRIKALDRVSLNVQLQSVAALLGPNGAGKTTLIRILTTLLKPDFGKATMTGLDVVKDAQRLRSIIGLAGQSVAVDEVLSGRENLEMVGRLYHLNPRYARFRADELLNQFDLEEAADRPVKTYSGGMRRRLDLAASLVIRPKILFLDEPTAGLDPRSRFGLWHIIHDLVQSGTTVLLTTQYLEEADQLAHQIFVIDHGRIIAQGTADELKRKVGGDILEIHMVNHSETLEAAKVIRQFGSEEPSPNPETGIVTMPFSNGTSVLVEVVRQLDKAQLKLNDITLRRPSLNDVFMKLTGHGAE